MEPFWLFRLRFRRAYDSAFDSDFQFSLGRSALTTYDSVASQWKPVFNVTFFGLDTEAFWRNNLKGEGVLMIKTAFKGGAYCKEGTKLIITVCLIAGQP